MDLVLPCFVDERDDLIRRATIAQHGALTPRFQYLQDYVDGEAAYVG